MPGSGALLASLCLVCVAGSSLARTPVESCIGKKEFAAGGKIAAKMTCKAMETFTGTVDPRCLPKAESRFAISMAKAGSLCPGDAPGVEALVDACVATLVADAAGSRHCSVPTQIGLGKAARNILKCEAVELTRPGTSAACAARQEHSLNGVLVQAGSCAASGALADVYAACVTPVSQRVTP